MWYASGMATKNVKAGQQAWSSYRRGYGAVSQALEQELLGQCELSLAWYEALAYVHDAGEQRVRMQGLAGAVGLSPSGLTRMIDRMEAEKLLRRSAAKDDRRGVNVALTAAGSKALARAMPVYQRGVQAHFAAKLAERDLDALQRAGAKLAGGTSGA